MIFIFRYLDARDRVPAFANTRHYLKTILKETLFYFKCLDTRDRASASAKPRHGFHIILLY